MNPLRSLLKPCFVHRPAQLWRRVRFALQKPPRPHQVELPWRLRMLADPDDDLGRALQTTGIYDLVLTESLFRLADLGEFAVDVGANVGYATGILGARVGRVTSFEPHPTLYQELCENIDQWGSQHTAFAEVDRFHLAVSNKTGEATLHESSKFRTNRGTSSLVEQSGAESLGRELMVMTTTLDGHFGAKAKIGLLKVDVEGHEEQVFAGAAELLRTGRMRDVLFEEFAPYPAATHRMLEAHGLKVFVAEERLRGPVLVTPDGGWKPGPFALPNYIATLDPAKLQRRFEAKGWHCLA